MNMATQKGKKSGMVLVEAIIYGFLLSILLAVFIKYSYDLYFINLSLVDEIHEQFKK